MKGVLAGRAPEAHVVDVTHAVPPQDVLAGALVLRHAAPWFPRGTIHVAVVDPGVGSARRPLCVETADALFVGPDNGLISLAAPPDAVRRIVHLTETRFFLQPVSRTFHGRDVFAPVAAALATGVRAEVLGTRMSDMQRLVVPAAAPVPGGVRGQVIYVDAFGNLVTNLDGALAGAATGVCVGAIRLPGVLASYSDVAVGKPVAVVGSWGLVEIAVRGGSARATLAVGVGEPVTVETR